jgi:helicase MOV-10
MNHVHERNDNQACDPGVTAAQTNDTSFCELCEMAVENQLWESHLGCAKHIYRLTFIRYKAAIKEAEADKDGIAIEGVFDFDCIAPQTAQRGVKNPITIRATRSHTQCLLLDFKLCSSNSGFVLFLI